MNHPISQRIDAQTFYATYHGHPVGDLEQLHASLRAQGKKIVFLVGDSSLDNKHWLFPAAAKKLTEDERFVGAACNGYEMILDPPRCVMDVCYHMNVALAEAKSDFACINAAVEESTVSDREGGRLLEQDEFVLRNLRDGDVVICSLGGNDIALRPSKTTMAAIGSLNFLTPQFMARRGYGLGFGHLGTIFKDQIQAYLTLLVGERQLAAIMPCTIYYPSVTGHGWADQLFNTLGYTNSPAKLQILIDACFTYFTSEIRVGDIPMIPIELSKVLDANDANDYDNRVEPSVQGGRKMGVYFASKIRSGDQQ